MGVYCRAASIYSRYFHTKRVDQRHIMVERQNIKARTKVDVSPIIAGRTDAVESDGVSVLHERPANDRNLLRTIHTQLPQTGILANEFIDPCIDLHA